MNRRTKCEYAHGRLDNLEYGDLKYYYLRAMSFIQFSSAIT